MVGQGQEPVEGRPAAGRLPRPREPGASPLLLSCQSSFSKLPIDSPSLLQPVWHTLRSSRSRSTVSGALLVQIGFVPAEPGGERRLSPQQRERILGALHRVADEQEHARRASREERVFLAAPVRPFPRLAPSLARSLTLALRTQTETVGTSPADDLAPLGDTIADPDSESSSSDDDSVATGEESESETGDDDDDDDASTSADDDDLAPAAPEPPRGYFDLRPTSSSSTTTPAAMVQSPVPDIIVQDHAFPASTPQPSGRRGLSLPGFVKRRFSTQSGSASPSLMSSQPPTPSAVAAESDLALTDLEGGGASSSSAPDSGRKRRFARRRGKKSGGSDTPSGIADDIVEMSLVAGGVGVSRATTPALDDGAGGEDEGGKRRRRRRRSKGDKLPGDKKIKKKKRSAKSRKRAVAGFTYDDDEAIAGLVQVEITGAHDLPRLKNALRTSYDMDPFCVISFGKKIFRTRVIRHSLNPVWSERLWFHVGEAETHWTIGFTVSDWDKMSGNDHVGDVAVPLEQLLGTSIQHDARGLYPAAQDGKLVGDDFHEHDLPLVMGDKVEREANGAKPTLKIRAKYTPYAALRQQFWRCVRRPSTPSCSPSARPLAPLFPFPSLH